MTVRYEDCEDKLLKCDKCEVRLTVTVDQFIKARDFA